MGRRQAGDLGGRHGRCIHASLMAVEGSHVSMTGWLLGGGQVLAACEHHTARAPDKRYTVKPMASECLHSP